MAVLRAERKRIDRDHLAKAPPEAKVIKMLDRLDNLAEMELAPAEFKTLYGEESLLLAQAVGDADPKLRDNLVNSARALIASSGHERRDR
jgi:hypothetical protein